MTLSRASDQEVKESPRGSSTSVVVGVLLLLLGAVMVKAAFSVDGGRDLVRGPRLFPAVITISFAVLAAAYLAQQVTSRIRRHVDTAVEPVGDGKKVGLMVVLLLVYGRALEPVGYVLATFILFVAGAVLLGSRAWKRDLVVGLCLSVGIYVVFTQLLSVRLPQGVIPLG